MKIDFQKINANFVKTGSVFFLYGNYKKTFEIFCEFIREEFQKKSTDVSIHFCTVPECVKMINGQCDLFKKSIDCFCIKNVEDNHLEKVSKFFEEKNCVFILESGNYMKSKKITDYFSKSEAFVIPSFDNEMTRYSVTKMFFPNVSRSVLDEIVRIINNTDEELYSVFKKISFLSDNSNLLKDYFTHKQSFLSGLDLIPLIRFLLQTVMRERIVKSPNFSKINIQSRDAISHLLNSELIQKFGVEIGRGHIYQRLML